MGTYGWPRLRVVPRGGFGSERSLRTLESDQLDPAGHVNRRREGNPWELTAGQDRRDGTRDKE